MFSSTWNPPELEGHERSSLVLFDCRPGIRPGWHQNMRNMMKVVPLVAQKFASSEPDSEAKRWGKDKNKTKHRRRDRFVRDCTDDAKSAMLTLAAMWRNEQSL